MVWLEIMQFGKQTVGGGASEAKKPTAMNYLSEG